MVAQALYVHTAKGVLIQINTQVRLPRTFRRFCGLFVQLLQKLSIRASNGPDKLLKACPWSPLMPPPCTRSLLLHFGKIAIRACDLLSSSLMMMVGVLVLPGALGYRVMLWAHRGFNRVMSSHGTHRWAIS